MLMCTFNNFCIIKRTSVTFFVIGRNWSVKTVQLPGQYLWFIFEQKCPSPHSSPLYRNRDVLTWKKLSFQYVLWLSGLWCHVIQLVGTNISDYSVSDLLYVISFKKVMYFWFCVCSLPQMKGHILSPGPFLNSASMFSEYVHSMFCHVW